MYDEIRLRCIAGAASRAATNAGGEIALRLSAVAQQLSAVAGTPLPAPDVIATSDLLYRFYEDVKREKRHFAKSCTTDDHWGVYETLSQAGGNLFHAAELLGDKEEDFFW